MKKKTFALIIAAALLASCLSGCGKTGPAAEEAPVGEPVNAVDALKQALKEKPAEEYKEGDRSLIMTFIGKCPASFTVCPSYSDNPRRDRLEVKTVGGEITAQSFAGNSGILEYVGKTVDGEDTFVLPKTSEAREIMYTFRFDEPVDVYFASWSSGREMNIAVTMSAGLLVVGDDCGFVRPETDDGSNIPVITFSGTLSFLGYMHYEDFNYSFSFYDSPSAFGIYFNDHPDDLVFLIPFDDCEVGISGFVTDDSGNVVSKIEGKDGGPVFRNTYSPLSWYMIDIYYGDILSDSDTIMSFGEQLIP